MGRIEDPRDALLFAAIFSRYDAALQWARETMSRHWGELALRSDCFAFTQTHYYQRQMGGQLKKQLVAFLPLRDPSILPALKVQANQWEDEYARLGAAPEPRPLNVDPGYVTEAKLVLASTKDRDHRLYIGQGIYAENTLYYQQGQWLSRPWTYPDYQTPAYHEFLDRCRRLLREQLGRP